MSTSLPSCCSPLEEEPNIRKEVTPNCDFKCSELAAKILMYSIVDFIEIHLTHCKYRQ